MNGWAQNPYIQMGLGILGGNRGPNAFNNAMRGGLSALQEYNKTVVPNQFVQQQFALQQELERQKRLVAEQTRAREAAEAAQKQKELEAWRKTLPPEQQALAAAYGDKLAAQQAQGFYPEPVSPGVTVHNVAPAQQTAAAKTVGTYYGNEFINTQKGEREARAQNARLDRLGKLMDQTYTGMGGNVALSAKKAARLIGLDMSGVGEAEAADALAKEMALALRSPAGGAGMPGAMSDSDRAYLEKMVPSLATSPEGRKLMIETRRKVNKRSIQVAKMARDYRRKHGELDEGFLAKLAEYADRNPLFSDNVQPEPKAAEWGIKRVK